MDDLDAHLARCHAERERAYKLNFRLASREDLPIWLHCPICDGRLEGDWPFGAFAHSFCPKGHYEYQNKGS